MTEQGRHQTLRLAAWTWLLAIAAVLFTLGHMIPAAVAGFAGGFVLAVWVRCGLSYEPDEDPERDEP